MEILVFALAARNGHHWQDAFVTEPAEFRPFDLRALRIRSVALARTPRI